MRIQNDLPWVSLRTALCLGVGGWAALSALPAWAQAVEAVTPATETQAEPALEEIIVTAQRRSENMQRVPISVTALTGESLASTGILSTLSLSTAVPAVQLTRSGPGVQSFIRGVGNVSGGIGEEGANAFYIDGVYLADQNQINVDFNNIERIEVLKGPQGTLFGRNSSGGLVNIITKDPGQDTVVSGKIGYGNYQTVSGQLYVATPITPTLSIGVALTGRDQNDGWGTNLSTGEDTALGYQYAGRGKLVWQPTDTVKITLAGDYTRLKDSFTSFTLRRGSVGAGGYEFVGDYDLDTPDENYISLKYGGVSLTAEVDLDWATLTNIAAYRKIRARADSDSDYTPLPLVHSYVPSISTSFQEEARLSSNSTSPLSWQVGLFYFRNNVFLSPFRLRGTAVGGLTSGYDSSVRQRTESIAGFGEIGYSLTPTTHLTLGARYTHEKREYEGVQTSVNIPTTSPLYAAFNFPLTQRSASYGKVTYRAAIRQELNDDVNVYASYNRGFKSGGFALNASPLAPVLEPQTTDAFEIGLKSELFERRVRLNLAGFRYDMKDYQTRSAGAINGTTNLLNATSLRITGLEGELEVSATSRLRLTSNFVLLRSRFGAFPFAPYSFPSPAACNPLTQPPGAVTGPATGGNITCLGSAAGNRAPLAPKFTGNIGATYVMPIGDGELTATALYSHNSGYYFEADNRLRQSAFGMVNASLEYRPTERIGLELYVNNLTDRRPYISSSGTNTGDQGVQHAPRTYGLNIRFDL